MESLDEFLYNQGWRPSLDTLAKFSKDNVWIKERFFTNRNLVNYDFSLSVFMLTENVMEENILPAIVDFIKDQGFVILEQRTFDADERSQIARQTRGGNWKRAHGEVWENNVPAAALVLFDPRPLGPKPDTENPVDNYRVRKLKTELRNRFYNEKTGPIVHGTDNTQEAKEYIRICFPDR